MAHRKRSERQIEPEESGAVGVIEKAKVEPALKPSKPTGEYRSAFCPVCGVAHGTKTLGYPERGYYSPPATQNYWEWITKRDDERGLGKDEPFGVIQEIGRGKGHSFTVLGYFSPEEDEEFYPLIKARLLQAVRRWLENGWLARDEVMNLVSRAEVPELESELESAIKQLLTEHKKMKVTELTAAVLTGMGLAEELTDPSRQRQAAGMNRKVKAVLWQLERDGFCKLQSLGRVVVATESSPKSK